jgi:hypothetical protein
MVARGRMNCERESGRVTFPDSLSSWAGVVWCGAETRAGRAGVFAEMKDPVRRKIEHYERTRTNDPEHFFPTLGAAMAAFRRKTGADWTRADGG